MELIDQKILICFGTRPEYIKVKSIIDNFKNIKTCFTGQHKDLLKNIKVDYELNMDEIISENRLNNIICNILKNTNIFTNIEKVLVQGDTTTALAIAISAFNNGLKVVHLEAGLRSNDLNDPYPEEANRQLISRIAAIHLCPTEFNKENLLNENVKGQIYVTGNTGLDNISKEGCEYGNQVLITMHRRDNHELIDKWFENIEKIANKYSNIEFLIPLHPNPNVQKHKAIFKKVKVVEPMTHEELIEYVKKCKFVISDSGGLQEECSFLNKKIIVCRKTTERPESVGIHSFMCENPDNLETLVDEINNNYEVNSACPYGDGKSWKMVYDIFYLKSNSTNLITNRYEALKKYIPINKDFIVLGIGEGYRQTIPNGDILKFYNCDYFSNEEIKNERGISSESKILGQEILNIDFVCKDNNYLKSVNKINYFDLIVTNHCMEHLDNFIDFLKQINKLLKDGGYLFFTLPDKKYSFDNLRTNTDIAHLIYDFTYNEKNQHLLHLIETEVFYNNLNPPNNSISWLAKNRMKLKKYCNKYDDCDNRFKNDIHPGVHRHVFEYETFIEKIIEPILYLYFNNFELITCNKINNTGEFYTILQKKTDANIKFPNRLFTPFLISNADYGK